MRPSGLSTASSSPPSPSASLRDAYLATGTGCTSRTNLTHTTLLITRYLKACPLVQRLLAAPPILSGARQMELFCSFPYARGRRLSPGRPTSIRHLCRRLPILARIRRPVIHATSKIPQHRLPSAHPRRKRSQHLNLVPLTRQLIAHRSRKPVLHHHVASRKRML